MPTPVELSAAGVTAPMMPPSAAAEPTHFAALPVAVPAAPVVPAMAAPVQATAATSVQAHAREAVHGVRAPRTAASTRVPSAQPQQAASSDQDSLVKQAFRSLNRGDAQKAIAQARRVVDAEPSRADAWLVLGSAYALLHDRPSALLAFRACTLRGQGPQARTCEQLARE
jgi:cytochrome c-type biogenesis protein CcmH/NrfG